jgi:membrane complex biogenesis BtpA family protein
MKNFWINKPLLGMIHLQALPGSPLSKLRIAQIYDKAAFELEVYQKSGVSGIIIENMHDVPYQNRVCDAATLAGMTSICTLLRLQTDLPMGIQILAGANKEALAAALAANLNFIRAEGFVFAHLADEGPMNADAPELLRYRKNIGAEHIKIFTDIKKKHASHAITTDVSIEDTAKAAEFFLSDGLIVTGKSTGMQPETDELKKVKTSVKLPVWIGSGMTDANFESFFHLADGFIVGSWFKVNGDWKRNVDEDKVKYLVTLRNILMENNPLKE